MRLANYAPDLAAVRALLVPDLRRRLALVPQAVRRALGWFGFWFLCWFAAWSLLLLIYH